MKDKTAGQPLRSNGFTTKFRYIYVPFLLISVGFIITYTLLNWLLVIKTEILSIDSAYVEFGGAFVLPWIPVLIWLRPRMRILRLSDGSFVRLIFATLAIAAPTMVAQHYIGKAAGGITHLEHVDQIDSVEKTRYYTFENISIDTSIYEMESRSEPRGKDDTELNIAVYSVFPFINPGGDSDASKNYHWLGVIHDTTVARGLPKDSLRAVHNRLLQRSFDEARRIDPDTIQFLERVTSPEPREEFESAALKSGRCDEADSLRVLMPHFERYEERSGNSLAWIFYSFGLCSLGWLLFILGPKVDTVELKRIKRGEPHEERGFRDVLDYLLFRGGYVITPILVEINVLIFLIMMLAGLGFRNFRPDDLLAWGALNGHLVADGQVWRLVSYMFVHTGFIHLFNNMIALLLVGYFLEPVVRPRKLIVSYLASGVVAAVASLLYNQNVVAAGASGAIFGLYGILFWLIASKNEELKKERVLMILIVVQFAINLVIGALTPWIDNAAHLGGFATGLAIGAYLSRSLRKQRRK